MDQLDQAVSNQNSAVDDQAAIQTVSVYTRHKRSCPKRERPDWARCNCAKWLYVYRNGKSKQISAKTRSWERAEQKAREVRDSFDPVTILQKRLQAKTDGETSEVEVDTAVEQFLAEVARLNRAEATCDKYKLTLGRLSKWCNAQETSISFLSELNVAIVRRWIHSWSGAPTTLHNTHQRVIAFFNFCIEQGWRKENPAKKIRKVPRQQEETLPFTREQYDALIEATYHYDGRGEQRNGGTTNSRRTRAYLKLLRWSGFRAGDGACLAKSKLRDDDSLVLYQAKVKSKNSAPVWVLLPSDVAQELRSVPPSSVTHPDYFFGSSRSKRKSEVSKWEKIFGKVLDKAVELFPKLFVEASGERTCPLTHVARYICCGIPFGGYAPGRGVALTWTLQRDCYPEALCPVGLGEAAALGRKSKGGMGEHGASPGVAYSAAVTKDNSCTPAPSESDPTLYTTTKAGARTWITDVLKPRFILKILALQMFWG